jgi:trimethylamine corrinoid protein
MNKEELFSKIQGAVVELNEEKLIRLTKELTTSGIDLFEAIEKAYTKGIRKVGDRFDSGEFFLPELIKAGKIVKDAISEIKKFVPKEQIVHKGKMVIGTVQGDMHNLGKDLVATMLETRGIETIDIGVDCSVDKFIDRAIEENVDIIGVSCLLTTTVLEQKKLIDRMVELEVRDRFKVIIGGAAVDAAWSKKIGADGYGANIKEAVDLTLSLINKEG